PSRGCPGCCWCRRSYGRKWIANSVLPVILHTAGGRAGARTPAACQSDCSTRGKSFCNSLGKDGTRGTTPPRGARQPRHSSRARTLSGCAQVRRARTTHVRAPRTGRWGLVHNVSGAESWRCQGVLTVGTVRTAVFRPGSLVLRQADCRPQEEG